MIPKGKFDWYTPDKVMSQEAGSVFNAISANVQLPHIPAIVMKVQQMLQDPDVDMKTLAAQIKQEPLIASNIFKTANRMKAARNRHDPPFQSLEHAMVYIGTQSLGDIVLTASLHSFNLPTKKFKADDVWETSAICALIAEEIAAEYNPALSRDEAFLAGYLANVGKIVGALCFPDKVDGVYNEVYSPTSLTSWTAIELRHDIVDHCILGELGAALWGLPDFVLSACRFHHSYARTKENSAEDNALLEVVALANYLTHWLTLQPHRIHEAKFESLKAFFNLSEEDLFAFAEGLKHKIKSVEAVWDHDASNV